MHVAEAALVLQRLDALARLVEVAAEFEELRAVGAHGGVLLRVVAHRHHDGAADALALARERDRLAVVAGGRRDDAAALARAQRGDQVHAAADLEGAGRIVVLVLDEDIEPRLAREQRMAHERRRAYDARDARPGGVDVFERWWNHRRSPFTSGTMISGRSVISASTPQSSSRRASASLSTVQT